MSRRRAKKAKQPTPLKERLKGWWSGLRQKLGSVKPELLGLGLIILVILTLLGLLGISSGSVLGWWATALRQLFGWCAFLLAIGCGFLGLRLMWKDLRDRVQITVTVVIGVELLLLVLMVASHVPLQIQSDPGAALRAAQDGKGGGYIGWALSLLLVEGLGPVVGAFTLLLGLAVALFLLLPLTWADLRDQGQFYSQRLLTSFNRWRMARQGNLVVPDPEDVPWWEQEPDPSESGARRSGAKKPAKKPRKRKPARRSAKPASLPTLDLLDPASPQSYGDTDVRRKMQIIEETLEMFRVPSKVVEVNRGPTVTQFGLDPGYIERRASGGEVQRQRVRVGRIVSLADDLALALAASPIRIEAPVPGRSIVGLEVPNDEVSLVSLRAVMESRQFKSIDSPLVIALGEDVAGESAAVDLGLMPHLLIAGATGSGKSVCINAIICCLLFNNTPEDLRMLMIDPKMVELTGYNGIPHLLAPVVVDVEQVVGSLAWVTRQMDERYKLFNKVSARNIEDYNQRMGRRKDGELLPTLVVFIDELADLMMVAPDEVERHICRVAQMGRATGIHLVIATQRPSVDVVTGLIKANFPARISFSVTSQVDSRVILDRGGAENLLGRGDMLFLSPQHSSPVRLQGCFVSDKEIDRLTEFWRGQDPVEEQTALFPPWTELEEPDPADRKLQEAIALIEGRDRVSTSFVQRQLRVGFPRAARLMDQLEELGLVGADEGGGRGREVLVGRELDFDEIEERLPGVEPS